MAFSSRKRISKKEFRKFMISLGVNEQRLIDHGLLDKRSLFWRVSDWGDKQHWTVQILLLVAAGSVLGLAMVGASVLLRMVP